MSGKRVSVARARRRILVGAAASVAALSAIPAFTQADATPVLEPIDATTLPCNFGAAVKSPEDQKIRLAMIVGVDSYQDAKALRGAVPDAGKVYNLIVENQKKAFPKENVCVLTNAEATYEGFKQAFQKALVDRAEGAAEVLVYYAGHGSQLRDENNDDGDGWDETLFLHDSQRVEQPEQGLKFNQLRDDEFNGMLAALYKKSENLTVILDSCHSGTATRDIEGGDTITRYVEPAEEARQAPAAQSSAGDGGFSFANFTPASMPNAVFLSAARDDEKAIERSGAGLFTRALVSVLSSPDASLITYNQLSARVMSELGVEGKQTPVLSGKGERAVFTKDVPYQPRFDWVVSTANGATATIRGLPTIGMGPGAEFLILPNRLTPEQARNPNIAKARMRAVSGGGNEWKLERIKDFGRGAINPGDFASLALPSSSARKLKVRIRPANEAGGVPDGEALRQKIVANLEDVLMPGDVPLVDFVDRGFDLEITRSKDQRLQLEDSRRVLRNAYAGTDAEEDVVQLAQDLSNHFQQIVLLNEWRIAGGTMVPNETLQVRLKPVTDPRYNVCKKMHTDTSWPGEPNKPQRIPLCASYEIVVKLAEDAPIKVVAGGSVLSADGSMVKIPFDNKRIELAPGQEVSFGLENVFQATPESYGKKENIYIIGLPAVAQGGEPAYQIPWHLLSTSEERTRALPVGRGERPQKEYGTYTILPIETVANSTFGKDSGDALSSEVITREYTIPGFNIAPYLPDDVNSALHRVLKVAESLTDYEGSGDGVPYKQHLWCKGSTKANLAAGIDCSRSIWYAFTRAGLPYNRHAKTMPSETQCVNPYDPAKDGYLYTGDMARKDYLMKDNFVECLAANEEGDRSFRLGDVLVYRDKTKGDGHVVMVIDPDERIAWGSHGWDGNPRLLNPDGSAPEADRGVEFQKIKFKADWERWDRGTMELAACWRHKQFVEEAKTAEGRPGYAALCEAIDVENPLVKDSLCWRLSR